MARVKTQSKAMMALYPVRICRAVSSNFSLGMLTIKTVEVNIVLELNRQKIEEIRMRIATMKEPVRRLQQQQELIVGIFISEKQSCRMRCRKRVETVLSR